MAAIRGYMAASADGFIADRDGGIDWLKPFDAVDYGYDRFIASIRTVVMGRATYDQVLTLAPEWMYRGKRGLVVTSRTVADAPPDVSAWTGGVPALAAYLRNLDDGDVWIVGGSQLQSEMIDRGALDRLELFVIPVHLGDGIPLFRRGAGAGRLTVNGVDSYENGVVRIDYGFSVFDAAGNP